MIELTKVFKIDASRPLKRSSLERARNGRRVGGFERENEMDKKTDNKRTEKREVFLRLNQFFFIYDCFLRRFEEKSI